MTVHPEALDSFHQEMIKIVDRCDSWSDENRLILHGRSALRLLRREWLPMVDDNHLLARVAQGDRPAFHELYARYYQRLWQYVRYHFDEREDWIEEVLQEIFLAIWRAAPQFRGAAKVSTWIFQIAHHIVINARRSRGRQILDLASHLADDGENEPVPEEMASLPLEEMVTHRLELIAAIEQLSPKHQEVIFLVFVQGFAPDEVARILAVPLNTVRSRVIHARKALQKNLDSVSIVERGQRHA